MQHSLQQGYLHILTQFLEFAPVICVSKLSVSLQRHQCCPPSSPLCVTCFWNLFESLHYPSFTTLCPVQTFIQPLVCFSESITGPSNLDNITTFSFGKFSCINPFMTVCTVFCFWNSWKLDTELPDSIYNFLHLHFFSSICSLIYLFFGGGIFPIFSSNFSYKILEEGVS